MDKINELNEKIKEDIDKVKIELTYYSKDNGYYNLFGDKFVENNKNNIKLNINKTKIDLCSRYYLEERNNFIEIDIINPVKNLEYMFYNCSHLTCINGLHTLDMKNYNNFSYMFYGCSSLKDIKGLEKWNVSNGNNFSYMFYECSSLKDIKGLENWNVSNGNNFSYMFYGCSSLSNISLENWNISNEIKFNECPSSSDFILYIVLN